MQFDKWMSLEFIKYLEDNMEEYTKEHWTVEGFTLDGSKTYRAKKSYTELKAQEICFKLNLKPETIHKLVSYKCSICGNWHIGHHNDKILNDKEKAKIKKKYNEWKIIHNIR